MFDNTLEQRMEDENLEKILSECSSPPAPAPRTIPMAHSPALEESPAAPAPMVHPPATPPSPMAPPLLPHPSGLGIHYQTIASNASNAVGRLLEITARSKAAGRKGLKRKYVPYEKPALYHHTLDWEVLEGEVGAGEVVEEDGAEVEEQSGAEDEVSG